jgi:hypothetical protein
MKTLLMCVFMLGTATVFAQSTSAPSTPQPNNDKPKTGFGPKSDIRNPFDSTKNKATHRTAEPKKNNKGWGDVGVAPNNTPAYIGATEKNKRPAKIKELGEGDDPFGKKNRQQKPTNNLGVGDDPFGKKPTKKKVSGVENN